MVSQMIIGIDPGVRGAIAILDKYSGIDTLQMPMQEKLVDIGAIIKWFDDEKPSLVVVERVMGFGKGSISVWCQQGVYYGQLIGWLQTMKWSFLPVTPMTWKAATIGLKKPKDASISYVKNLYPAIEWVGNKDKRIGQADAICLALYGRRFLGRIKG